MRIDEVTLGSALLKSLERLDQRERSQYGKFVQNKAGGDWSKGAELYAKSKNRKTDDVFGERGRLEIFTNTDFDFSSFDKTDWSNYHLLVQHCDFDRDFQKKALQIIAKYQGENEQYKYLYDRISCGLNGTQKYNTQSICKKD